MSKKDEALKLALETLKQIDEAMPFPVAKLAQKAIREALAEQPEVWVTPKLRPLAKLAKELDGVVADVEQGDGFDDVCLDTVKYVRDELTTQPAQQELEELTTQRDKLADILTRTANALKGQPAELSSHSWHDLPEVAQQIKAAQQQQEPVAYASDVEFDDETEIIPAEQKGKLGTAGLRIPLYIEPLASKPWVGLTDKEIEQVCVPLGAAMLSFTEVARAIEAKLKEKNA